MFRAIKSVLSKPAVWVCIIYMLFPLDVIPDAIPVVGTVDDVVVMLACFAASVVSRK